MVTLQTAENALKEVYLGVVANQINIASSPLLARIKRTSKDIYGKEIVKAAPFGVNGGFGAGGETDALPLAVDPNYVQFRSDLKNLYGKFEISDKAVRASASNAGAFVNLLADEMESLVKSCSFNLSRMLYGTGSGLVATVSTVGTKELTVDSTRNVVEGMLLDVYAAEGSRVGTTPLRVVSVDRANKKFKYDGFSEVISEGAKLYVQGSKDKELTGVEALFSGTTLYGLTKADHAFLNAHHDNADAEISDIRIQSVIDFLEENADSSINFIATSRQVRRAYQQYLNIYRKNVDIVDMGNGMKTISHNGIPVYADRFVEEGSMYLLNTDDFTLYELGDWSWISDEAGRVIRQNPGYPTYSATLVKYAELICDKPFGQGKISHIKSTVEDPYKTYIPE